MDFEEMWYHFRRLNILERRRIGPKARLAERPYIIPKLNAAAHEFETIQSTEKNDGKAYFVTRNGLYVFDEPAANLTARGVGHPPLDQG